MAPFFFKVRRALLLLHLAVLFSLTAAPPVQPPDVDTLVEFCASVASAAPKTPFLYYHYPGITGVNLPVYDFFEKAHGAIPTLRGTLPCLMESRRDEDA
jgi:N-acetylneuraminate lyase